MLTDYILQIPQTVYGGLHALENIPKVIQGAKKAAVFTDPGIRGAGLLDCPLSLIRNAGTDTVIFDDLPAEPTCDQAQDIIDRFRASNADFIVAIGGGSVMDIAKLASIIAGSPWGVRDLLEDPLRGSKQVRTLMIPTTAGTGAEATPNSIVAVPEKELKVGIVNSAMIADFVILDGRMIRSLPRKIAASTGVDALCHAIECFTSKKANPFSDTFALEALDLILNNIETACDDANAMDAKNAMLTAAFYAGIAITASGTTAVHALSYPLGGKYHIPHGVSNAMLLVPVMKFNEPACREKFAAAYDRTARFSKAECIALTVEEKSAWIIQRLESIVKHLEIPTSLKDYGIGSEDLEDLVSAGMEVTRLLVNNMREVTPQAARELYRSVM